MSLERWNERYRAGEQLFDAPVPLVVQFAGSAAGRALDLACGSGRNALYLAELGWQVTAVDGSPVAVDVLRARAAERGLEIDIRVADLERGEFELHYQPMVDLSAANRVTPTAPGHPTTAPVSRSVRMISGLW